MQAQLFEVNSLSPGRPSSSSTSCPRAAHWRSKLTGGLSLAAVVCWLISLTLSATSATTTSHVDVHLACKQGLDFATIKEFRAFVGAFRQKSEEQLQQERVAAKCTKMRQAILELDALIISERVCDSSHIDELVSYHNKYLKSSKRNVFASKPVMRKFFSKYAIQVAHTCKRNLIRNLEESRELLRGQAKSLEEAKEKVFKEQPGLRSNIKLVEGQPDMPSASSAKPKRESELALGEYREALTRLKQPEDILTFERAECEQSRTRRVQIAAEEVAMFFRPALVCLNLAQYYASSVLSIARLANYGYTAADAELDVKLADSPLVKDWLVATQLCEPMLYMRMETNEEGVATVDTCAERVASVENMVFEDNLGELEVDRMDEWLKRSEGTRQQAQKIMKTTMKKLAKVSLMKQLRQGGLKKRHMFKLGLKAVTSAAGSSLHLAESAGNSGKLGERLISRSIDVSALTQYSMSTGASPDERSFEVLMRAMSEDLEAGGPDERGQRSLEYGDESDGAVSMFDPLTSLASTITIIAIMLTFEWLFFVVMTLAARICHRLNFNFDNLLTFPPKVLSFSDADFNQYSENLDKLDEDDFFDYDELTADEQLQRDLLAKVFGKPPPMLFRD